MKSLCQACLTNRYPVVGEFTRQKQSKLCRYTFGFFLYPSMLSGGRFLSEPLTLNSEE